MSFLKSFVFLALLVLTFSAAVAQSPGSVNGRVLLPDGKPINQSVRISLETARGVRSAVFTDNQGKFVFRGLTPGSYQLVVEADKVLWASTSVSFEVFPGAPSIVTIVLKPKETATVKTKTGGSVSTGELATEIPPKAKKEFERASEASKQGKIDDAIARLRKAIEIFPDYLMARNDLGALLLEQEKFSEAETELRKAISIDGKAFNPQLNLAIVLIKQKRYEEARDLLQRALSLEPNSPAARYYLGESLEELFELDLAAKEFTTAHDLGGPTFAVALFHLGNIYMKSGKRDLAKKAFQRYIAESPNGAAVAEARRRLGQLR